MPPQKSSYQVVRLWNIVDTSMTDQDVIKEFNTGFAPVKRSLAPITIKKILTARFILYVKDLYNH